jgi:BirA family biotin operon repressor/biotin-[acetyl-CoA-carboxylase] ligase
MPDPLPAELSRAIAAASPRLGDFNHIQYFADVDSTNDLALSLAAHGAPQGTVVLADAQRAGRGRQGRAWFSPPGAGLYLSVVIRPALSSVLSLVTIAAGVAVVRGLSAATGLSLELKWPNDVVIGRPWRKIAGILSESASAGSQIDAVVVGIGVNVRRSAFPPEIADRASAIEMETDRPVDAAACVIEILAAMESMTKRLAAGDGPEVVDAWRGYGRSGFGAVVRWQDEQGPRRGVARDIDETGALVVDADGHLERLVAGEVQWERLNRE